MKDHLTAELHVDSSVAEHRIEMIGWVPDSLHRFIPFDLALWWILRGIKVEVR